MPNRLANETSPYLRQHADNPVDWYPWGPEALQKAQREDRPIFLSIGYAACHWCHVMEEESFQDPATAERMNRDFVSIKVDREERPDIDQIYMAAVQAATGRGGWPMSVFLFPDGRPFFGGTYFPREDRPGSPSFTRILEAVARAWREQRTDLERSAGQLHDFLRRTFPTTTPNELPSPSVLDEAAEGLTRHFEPEWGGFAQAPKFPQAMPLEFVLRHYHRTRQPLFMEMLALTLERMALGGTYDQLGGGFHRYSTDKLWFAPHFEKMLYDNALLARLYLHAHQEIKAPMLRRVAGQTLDYVASDLRHPDGGFYSSRDADSEGEEGKYYVWSRDEVTEALGTRDAEAFCRYHDVSTAGNWESGRNILWVPRGGESVANELGMTVEQLNDVVVRGHETLLAVRATRVPPARDEKVLTDWNGLAMAAFAEAGAALGRPDYVAVARSNADFLLQRARRDGRLMHSWKDGEARVPAFLADYANLSEGLLALYEATFEPRWLAEARALAGAMLDLFWDEDKGALFDTARDAEGLIVRPRDVTDNATPSGSSAAAWVLLRLAVLTGEDAYRQRALHLIRPLVPSMMEHPMAFGNWLCALDFALSTVREIVVVGDPLDPATQSLLDVLYEDYLPNRAVAGHVPDGEAPPDTPLLRDRGMVDGKPTVYVCENYACRLPVNTPEALREQLSASLPGPVQEDA